MATKINDYTLEIGWSGSKVTKGLILLEKRIDRVYRKQERNAKQTQQKVRKPAAQRDTGRDTARLKRAKLQVSLNQQRNSQMNTYKNKIRSVEKAILRLDMTAKGAKGQKAAMLANISLIEAQKAKLTGLKVTTKVQMNAIKREWGSLDHKIKDSMMVLNASSKSFGAWATMVKVGKAALRSFGVAIVTMAVAKLTAVLFANGKQWENLRIQMQASFGSAEAGAERMDFLIGKSRELGVDVKALADGYAKIGVAARMSNMSTKDSEQIFLAAAEASRAFGLSTDDTQGVMRAFSQMLGKNQVMMEELKLQLGDRMPSAMGIFAKSMGTTVPLFMEMVKAGKVGNPELVKFAKFMREDIRASGAFAKSLQSVEAKQSRFNLALSQAGDLFFSAGAGAAMSEFFDLGNEFFTDTKEFWGFVGSVLNFVVKTGVAFLKLVILPVQKALRGYGLMWKELSRISLTNKSDVKELTMMEKLVRNIYLLFVDVWIISKELGLQWDRMFTDLKGFIDAIFGSSEAVEQVGTGGRTGAAKKRKGKSKDASGSYQQFWSPVLKRVGESVEAAYFSGKSTDSKMTRAQRRSKGRSDQAPINVEKLVVTLPIGTTPEQTPPFVAAFMGDPDASLPAN